MTRAIASMIVESTLRYQAERGRYYLDSVKEPGIQALMDAPDDKEAQTDALEEVFMRYRIVEK